MRRQVIALGLANFGELAIQLLTPIVLVRIIDESGFGEYRLLWLVVATLAATVPLGMPHSLPYFLPRHGLSGQATYVRQVLLYMAAAALLSGLLLSPLNPVLPYSLRSMSETHLAANCFWALWIFASTLDVLVSAEQRFGLQAGIIFGAAVLRGGAVIAAALLGGISAIMWALAFVAGAKAILLLVIPTIRYGQLLWFEPVFRWLEQFRYAIPLGTSSSIYLLRQQADHWIVVIFFSSAQYGLYSIGVIAVVLASVMRVTINNVIFPEMSKAQAAGDLAKVLNLNNRANVVNALFIFPTLGYIFAAASPIIRMIYTDAYADAVPILRLNIVAFLSGIVEMTTVMYALRQGPYLAGVESISLLIGLSASYAGIQLWGLPGAAVGTIFGGVFTIIVVYRQACRLTGLLVRTSQNWRALARIGAAAVIASLGAYLAIFLLPPAFSHFLAILISGVAFCIAYLILLVVFRQSALLAEMMGLPPDLLHRFAKRFGGSGK